MTYKQSQIIDFLINAFLLIFTNIILMIVFAYFYQKGHQKGMQDQRGILKEGYQQAIDDCYSKFNY